MADVPQKSELFDFSLDALDFRQKLRHQLLEQLSASPIEPVDDNDLEWINAAGTPHLSPDGKGQPDRRLSKRPE